MVTKFEKVFFALVICFIGLTAIFWKEAKQVFGGTSPVEKEKLTIKDGNKKKDKGEEADNTTAGSSEIAIIKILLPAANQSYGYLYQLLLCLP